MYRLLIVDDSEEQALALRDLVAAYPHADDLSVECAFSVEELDEAISHGDPVDILVIDVDFGPDAPTGIEIVESRFSMGGDCQVIYVTGYIEYCTGVYRTEHVSFLLKPVGLRDLSEALDRACDNLRRRPTELLVVESGGVVTPVPMRLIAYVESVRRKVRIRYGREVVEASASLASIQKKLPSTFVQCHKSYVVNMDCIFRLEKSEVVLITGERIPVSQKRRREVRDRFVRHLQRRAGFSLHG
ncbi:response regulator [Eggerthellaceae bacterium zg-887]|uniref:LytR/AlgR family response regulator transcription factor n=1 Tax=Xiamenia xianingshaonis TaxID=2682776 RepID=UPI00140A5680|nr:LytTR family DNA-binding domain-containing protein [Xiamenia xianingshaonis]NHM15432.1 response regulator [Xiamenia xianingshaonis]